MYNNDSLEIDKNRIEEISGKIINEINPKTVLELGGKDNSLMEELRKHGVEVFELKSREIENKECNSLNNDYIFYTDKFDYLPEKFPKEFDLVIMRDVVNLFSEEYSIELIKLICSHTKDIIFSASSDINSEKNLNIRQMEYWAKVFVKMNFLRFFNYDASYLAKGAVRFVKKTETKSRIVEDYERELRIISYDIKDLKNCIEEKSKIQTNNEAELESLKSKIKLLKSDNEKFMEENSQAKNEVIRLQAESELLLNQLNNVNCALNSVRNSFWWKIRSAIENIIKRISNIFKRPGKRGVAENYKINEKYYKEREKLNVLFKVKNLDITKFISADEAIKQADTKFSKNIKFSIVVPLYNTKHVFLKEMIDSVINQTYKNWELCLADASDNDHSYVGEICRGYLNEYENIKYEKLEKNGGISENTNAAIELASGDFISLFDHDDILHPSALFETVKAIVDHNADMVYTDETLFKGNIANKDFIVSHFKPDFAIDNLRSNNYICHFTSFSRELFNKVGGFNKEFDGSQDHDLMLRLSEKARKIYHVRKSLYYWRSHEGSVASDISVKPYCLTAGINAVKSHLERTNIKAEVELIPNAGAIYNVKYALIETPKISVIIVSNGDNNRSLTRCIDSVISKTTYKDYEIVLVLKEVNISLDDIKSKYERINCFEWNGKFNFSGMSNLGARNSKGKYCVFLHDDAEIVSNDWLEQLLMINQRSDVGVVGGRIDYPYKKVQSSGVTFNKDGKLIYLHDYIDVDAPGYYGRLIYSNECSAVSSVCMMVKKDDFIEIGGFEVGLPVSFSDVDLCLRYRNIEKLVVYVPFAVVNHHEVMIDKIEKYESAEIELKEEEQFFKERWNRVLKEGDPYYNPNFDENGVSFAVKN